MTIAIGQKFGNEILLATDTRISDASASRQNIIPGRLKAIILSPTLSVAYAGHADPALVAIRSAAKIAIERGDAEAIENLQRSSARHDADVDFLVAQHAPTRLLKLSGGQCYEAAVGFAIGDTRVHSEVSATIRYLNASYSLFRFESPEEAPTQPQVFVQAFQQVLVNVTGAGYAGVGGLPVIVIGRPEGHSYLGLGGSFYVGPSVRTGETGEDAAAKASGLTRYGFCVVPPRQANVSVVGAVLPQAGMGWIYDPLKHDEPIAHTLKRNGVDNVDPAVAAMERLVESHIRQRSAVNGEAIS